MLSLVRPHFTCLIDRTIAIAFTLCDIAFAISYFVVPVLIVHFAHLRGMSLFPYRWMDNCFSGFIALCGAGHLMAAYTMWFGSYYAYLVELGFKVPGAIGSLFTMGAMWRRRHELARPPADVLARERTNLRAREMALDDTLNVVGGELGQSLRTHHQIRTEVHLREAMA